MFYEIPLSHGSLRVIPRPTGVAVAHSQVGPCPDVAPPLGSYNAINPDTEKIELLFCFL